MKFHKLMPYLFVIWLCLIGRQSNAAIPVIDPAALVKFQTQIVKMIEQVNLLNSQIDLMRNQLSSTVGDTAFSSFLGNTLSDAHAFLPDQLPNGVAGIINTNTGVSGLQTLAEDLREAHQSLSANDVYPVPTRDQQARDHYERESDQIFGSMAAAQNAYDTAGSRKSYLDRLRQSIASAQSPKEREQLALRIAIENSLLLNDIQQILALQILIQQQNAATRFDQRAHMKKARPAVKMDY